MRRGEKLCSEIVQNQKKGFPKLFNHQLHRKKLWVSKVENFWTYKFLQNKIFKMEFSMETVREKFRKCLESRKK